MDDFNKKRIPWAADPISGEIDQQVNSMPDRPRFVVAVISYDPNQDQKNRKIVEPFAAHLFKEWPLICFGKKLTITYFGFDEREASVLGDFLRSLEKVDFDEGVIYVDGLPTLHVRALEMQGEL